MMPVTKKTKEAVRMYLLLAEKDTTKGSLKQRFPNVTYVLENPNPGNSKNYGQHLFQKIDPQVYASFHNKLRELNDGNETVPNDLSDSSRLGRFYTRAAGFTDVMASVFSGSEDSLWQGGEHPPAQDREGLQEILA